MQRLGPKIIMLSLLGLMRIALLIPSLPVRAPNTPSEASTGLPQVAADEAADADQKPSKQA